MKARIDVKNRKEARSLRLGLERADVRAFVMVMGMLDTLPTDRSKARVMRYVESHFAEQDDE